MKKLFVLLLTAATFSVSAQTINQPAASPTQTIKQDFALSNIEIVYSRPNMKGRSVFGDLVPYDALWRTGANGPTTISFGEDVSVEGKAVKAGKYSVLTKPGRNSWGVMLCDPKVSVFNYKAGDEIVSFSVTPVSLPFKVETFTIMISNQTANSAEIDLIWSDVEVPIKVTADIDSKIMGQINKVMNGDNLPYYSAASYYYDNNKDMNQALTWINKAVEQQPDAYWVATMKARIQAKAGDKTGAIASAKKAMAIAEKAGNMDYVNINKKLISSLQ